MSERLSIRNSARSLKKYGSTSSNTQRNETLLRHDVAAGDTLQGIALKYGVSTEQIRRTNKLWASDSLFLREYLMIPVPLDSPFSPTNSFEAPTTPLTSSSKPLIVSPDAEDDEMSANSFLQKIDSVIATTKKEVKKFQGSSEYASCRDLNGYEKRKPAVSRLKQASNNNGLSELSTANHTIVMTQGKKVRTSLQKLERQQEEIFEL